MADIIRLKSKFVPSISEQGATAEASSYPHNDGGVGLHSVEDMLGRKPFYFQGRSGKLDTRAIGRVDVDKVTKEVDTDTLQVYLENITFADLAEDDLRLYSDQCFLNLFRLGQLILEYLLNAQDTLATSLEALASKHASARKAVHKSRAELHTTSSQTRALKREVRQKRATIARYEQFLAVHGPPVRGNASSAFGGSLSHSCLVCGKMFTSADFLQQHIVRKHALRQQEVGPGNSSTTTANSAEAVEDGAKVTQQDQEKRSEEFPSQLRLFVQMSSGQCLNMMVHAGATVGQLRGYINSAAGFAAAGPSKRLLYKGMHLHDDQRLNECRMPTESQILLIDAAERNSLNEGKIGSPRAEARGDAANASETSKQMAALLSLVRQQLEWTMRTESSRREHGVEAAEALEIRMRGMEASLPRRLEELMEESVGSLKSSLRKALDDMEKLHAKRSNAGALEDDCQDNENKQKEDTQQEKSQMTALTAEMVKVSQENEGLLRELADVKKGTADAVPSPAVIANAPGVPPVLPAPAALPSTVSSRSQHKQQVSPPEPGDAPGPSDDVTPLETSPRKLSSGVWDLTFPAPEGGCSRPELTVRVARDSTCETVCEAIAAKLDIAEARVGLLDKRRGGRGFVPQKSGSSELRRLYEEGLLELEVLQGSVLSDCVVDGLVDFYDGHVPVEARDSDVVNRSMAEVDLAAKRHAATEGDSMRQGAGDTAGLAEEQVKTIRARLSASLSPGERFLPSQGRPDQSREIGRIMNRAIPEHAGLTVSNVFRDEGEGGGRRLSREELQRVVDERKRGRPLGLERRMASVSKSMQKQLSVMLGEAEGELERLEREDSFGTYSSTDPSTNEGAQQQTLG